MADSIVAYATYPSWFENIEVYESSVVLFFGYVVTFLGLKSVKKMGNYTIF